MINSTPSSQTDEQQQPVDRFDGGASADARMIVPYLVGTAFFALIGLLLGWVWGCALGAVLGSFYAVVSWVSSGSYLYDLHEGKLMERDRAPESYTFTEELAAELGIDPPTIYLMDIDQPQVCVSATGRGRRVQGRLGISRGLFEYIHNDQLHVLLALSMARIATGEATLTSMATALASFPLQFAQSRTVNFAIGSFGPDPQCGLNAIGKFLLILFTPLSRAVLVLANVGVSVLRCDAAATRIGRRAYEPIRVEAALRWLQKQQPPPTVNDPTIDFNPAEAASYLVSPFESDYEINQRGMNPAALPLWKRCRFLITSAAPSLAARIAALESVNSGGTPRGGNAAPVGS